MLSLEDCLEFSDLATPEIEAIARHEHVPMVVAAEMGCQLLKTEQGIRCLECMILECAESARSHGHGDEATRYLSLYHEFHALHPGAAA